MKLKHKLLVPILITTIALLGYLVYLQGGFSASEDKVVNKGKPVKVDRQIIVKYTSDFTKSKKTNLEKKHNLFTRKDLKEINSKVYNLPAQSNTAAVVEALSREPGVELVEQDNRLPINDYNPNDPYYANWQQPLHKQVLLNRVWDIEKGDPSVIIAILDTGILSSHSELQGRLVSGYSAVGGNTEPTHYHGTAVAGYASANSDNSSMITSSCWECKIMPIKVSDQSDGWAYESDIADGLIWAANHGARVANISYGPLTSLNSAASYFYNKNGLVTSSAGNSNADTGLTENPYLITTAATSAGYLNSDGTTTSIKADYSSFGNNVDISAPGGDMSLTVSGSITSGLTGTSMAAPRVAGLIGLLMSYDPTLTNATIENIIKQSAEDYGDQGWDKYFGFGEIDAQKAFELVGAALNPDSQAPVATVINPTEGSVVTTQNVELAIQITDNSGNVRIPSLYNSEGKLTTVKSTDSLNKTYYWNLFLPSNPSTGQLYPSYTFTLKVLDFANNELVKNIVINTTTNGDITAPSVSLTNPINGATVSGTTSLSATASDNIGVSKVIFYADSFAIGTTSVQPYTINWDTSTFTNGSHTLKAVAYDTSNNQTTSSLVTVTVSNIAVSDTTAPTVSISSPTNGATVSGTTNFSVNATDNVAIKEVYATLDGTSLGIDTVSPYTFSYDTKQKPNGTYQLQATAIDTSNNISSTTITINILNTVDTQAPTITITSPANNSKLPKRPSVEITNSHTDNIGVVKVELYVDSKLYNTSFTYPFTFNWNTKKVTTGSHTLQLKAYDAAGNAGLSSIITVIK